MQHQYTVAVHGSAALRCMNVHVSQFQTALPEATSSCRTYLCSAIHARAVYTRVLNIAATVLWLQLCEDQEEEEDENDDCAEEYDADQDEAAEAEE